MKGWKIRETQGYMERMKYQEYSYLGGSGANGNIPGWLEWVEDQKYCRFGGKDARSSNTQGQVEGMRDEKYSRLVGRDER